MTQTTTPSTVEQTNTWNKVTFTGNLGKDPEMSYTHNGNAVTKFSLAVGQGKDKPTMWLNVECWKVLAEQCHEKLASGSRVEVEGRLAQDVWDGDDGKKRYAFKVVAQTVRLLKRSAGKAVSGFIEERNGDDDLLGEPDEHPF